VSAVISASLDYHATLEALAQLAVPELGDWCVVDVVEEDGTLARIAAAHSDPAREPLLARLCERFPPRFDGPAPAAAAVRSGEPVFLARVDDAQLARIAQGPEHEALVRALGLSSLIAVPLVARSDTLGAVTFACAERAYGDTDRALAEDFAQRAAQSISNARLYSEAQEASRAKSEFLAVMSHELRTPLNAVTGYADLLQAEVPGPVNEKQREHLERIKASAGHLVQIIEEILAFSRMESGTEEAQVERVDLRALVRETGELMEPLARQKGLAFSVRLPDAPAPVETDPAKVRQVLRNLISNAIKFTEEGGVCVEAVRDGARHLVRVADTGIGIPPEFSERVFEAFWQVEQSSRREVGGTGLGLAVARGLIELLGGELMMDSAPGEGTTFTLALPAAG
jgi:signal transduction histidine kinase